MTLYTKVSSVDRYFPGKNYLYAMTIYHGIAIFFFIYGVVGFKLQTLVGIDQSLIDRSAGIIEIFESGKGLMSTLIICAIILGIDLIFLLILSYDFRNLKLTMKKIYYIEVIIFIVALFIPLLRSLLLFFSLNTLQIFVLYHIATYFERYYIYIPRYIIVFGGYILLAKIVYFGIGELI